MAEAELQELSSSAIAKIRTAATEEELEKVRIEVLGRKGSLAQISRGMAALEPSERARVGKLLNSVKQTLEAALDERQASFSAQALNQRLASEWVDLTLPAPGPARQPASDHADSARDWKSSSSRWDSPCSTDPKSRPSTTTSTR